MLDHVRPFISQCVIPRDFRFRACCHPHCIPLRFSSSVGKPDLHSPISNGRKSHRGASPSLDLPGTHCADFDSLGQMKEFLLFSLRGVGAGGEWAAL